MFRIVIVEDNKEYAKLLIEYLERYEKELGENFYVRVFSNGINFLDEYNSDYDIVFMDIDIEGMNGLDTSRKLRESDESVCIIFITELAQYATKGYEVNALDFIVKPVGYFNFTAKLKRAIEYSKKKKSVEIIIKKDEGLKKVNVSDIYFIEVKDHTLFYNTVNGIIKERSTMKIKEAELKKFDFARISAGYLVNLRHITEITRNSVVINGEDLKISRTKKKEFLNILTQFMGDYIK